MGVRVGTAIIIAGFASALATGASAQSSMVEIVPSPPVEGLTLATPVTPLDVQDVEYPLESLLANEEGKVDLSVVVGAMGQVTGARVLKSSGHPRLDQQVIAIARTRWKFNPPVRGGQPTAWPINVSVTWKLPLTPADDYYSQMMGFSVTGKDVVPPKPNSETNRLGASDYPLQALKNYEQGEVALRAHILTDGHVGEVEQIDSSGHKLLDDSAASALKKRFTYTPGTVGGQPAEMWNDINFIYKIADGKTAVPRFCHSRPILGSSMSMNFKGKDESIDVNQWLHVVADGGIDDVLLGTQKGWMHFSPAMVKVASAAAHNGTVQNTSRAPDAGSLIGTRGVSRPPSCWYKGNVAVKAQ